MIAKRAKWLQTERQKNGYRVTTDAEIDRYTLRNMQKAFVPIEKIEKKFSAKIGNLSMRAHLEAIWYSKVLFLQIV